MYQRILKYTGEYKSKAYSALIALTGSTLFNVIPYFFIYEIIMYLLGESTMRFQGIMFRVGAIAVCSLLYACLYMKGLDLSHTCAYHTLENIRITLQKKLENQPLGEIQNKGTGTLKKMFTEDIESIEVLLAHSLPEGIANSIVPLFIFAAMLFVDWKLAFLSMLPLPLGMICVAGMSRAGSSRMAAYYNASRKMNNTIIEYVNGMEVVKVFNRDGESYQKFQKDVINYRDFTLEWFRSCRPWGAYTSILTCLCLFTLPVGSIFILNGYSTLADLILVICMSFGIGGPLLRAIGLMPSIPQIVHKIDALERVLNTQPLEQTDSGFSGTSHTVEFDNVHFSYRETEVLHGISLTAEEGTLLALVGESGSGKSTLAKLLVHFYDVSDGAIRIGGQDIRSMSLEALNNEISFVSQEQFLFNTSLMENIRLGKPDATDEEIMRAAEKAQCMDFLKRTEQGIYALAGDCGKQLSSGERQRISLARAILKNASIIVLDEATAFIDPENEEKMNRAIEEVIQGKTVIVIAHRLHSIIHANQICVMKKGQVVAAGIHEELLHTCGEYERLWSAAQSSDHWEINTGEGAMQ
ncbi:MAG: ABC transporter ATP-binding protein [Lachnospiraceae bacterium]